MSAPVYVIIRLTDGQYVAPPGSLRSYTRSLPEAHRFHGETGRVEAERWLCSDERLVRYEDAGRGGL